MGRYEQSLTSLMGLLQIPVSIEDQSFAENVSGYAFK